MRYMALAILLFLSTALHAEDAGPFFPLTGKYFCMNYAGKMVVVGKVAPKQYEVYYRDPMTGEGRAHMVLITQKSDFNSDGMVRDDLWVKTTRSGHDESIKVKVNGFNKPFYVLRESSECEAKYVSMLKHPSKEKIEEDKAYDEEKKKEIADQEAVDARMQQTQVADEQFAQLPKAKQKEIRAQKAKDQASKEAQWNAMSPKEQEAMCKAKGIEMDVQTYCMD